MQLVFVYLFTHLQSRALLRPFDFKLQIYYQAAFLLWGLMGSRDFFANQAESKLAITPDRMQ